MKNKHRFIIWISIFVIFQINSCVLVKQQNVINNTYSGYSFVFQNDNSSFRTYPFLFISNIENFDTFVKILSKLDMHNQCVASKIDSSLFQLPYDFSPLQNSGTLVFTYFNRHHKRKFDVYFHKSLKGNVKYAIDDSCQNIFQSTMTFYDPIYFKYNNRIVNIGRSNKEPNYFYLSKHQ